MLSLRQDGVISDDVFEQLSTEVDAQLSEGFSSLPEEEETRTQFLEVTLSDNSSAIGKTIAELNIPRAAVLVSIQRGEEVIIPRGDTILHAGDVVTTLCERETISTLKDILLAEDGENYSDEVRNEPKIE